MYFFLSAFTSLSRELNVFDIAGEYFLWFFLFHAFFFRVGATGTHDANQLKKIFSSKIIIQYLVFGVCIYDWYLGQY